MVITEISKSKLRSGDTLEQLRFLYLADPQMFISEFAKYGLVIESINDLPILVKERNSFLNGTYRRPDGTPIQFDLTYVMNQIQPRQSMIENSGIKFAA